MGFLRKEVKNIKTEVQYLYHIKVMVSSNFFEFRYVDPEEYKNDPALEKRIRETFKSMDQYVDKDSTEDTDEEIRETVLDSEEARESMRNTEKYLALDLDQKN